MLDWINYHFERLALFYLILRTWAFLLDFIACNYLKAYRSSPDSLRGRASSSSNSKNNDKSFEENRTDSNVEYLFKIKKNAKKGATKKNVSNLIENL